MFRITLKFKTTDQSTRAFSPKEFNGYKITRHSEANLRQSIKVCSLRRRRAGRLDELVQVNAVGDPSGCSDESLHKSSEVMFLGVGNLDCCQVSCRTSLQWTRTKDRATSAPHRAADFFHSCTRSGISFSRVIRDSRSFWSTASGQSAGSIRDMATFRRAK